MHADTSGSLQWVSTDAFQACFAAEGILDIFPGGQDCSFMNPCQTLQAVTYKVKWLIPNEHIDNIRGVEKSFRISIEYRRPIQLGQFVLKVPLRQGMRTTSSESHRNLILRLNRHIGRGGYVAPVALALPMEEQAKGVKSGSDSLKIALRRSAAL